MAMEPASDAVRRLRLELHAIVDDLQHQGTSPAGDYRQRSAKAEVARLREMAEELRRIAARGVTPDSRRDAEALAALVQNAASRFEHPPAKISD